MKKVLVVCAHPGDEILGCGATLALHVRHGDQVRVMIMGDGCASWRNVAYNAALQADSSGKCVYGTPVAGSPGLCAIDASVSLPWGPLRVAGTISVAQTVAAVLGGTCSGGAAPWAPLVASAAASPRAGTHP